MDSEVAVSMMKGGEATTMSRTLPARWLAMDAGYDSFQINHPGYKSLVIETDKTHKTRFSNGDVDADDGGRFGFGLQLGQVGFDGRGQARAR